MRDSVAAALTLAPVLMGWVLVDLAMEEPRGPFVLTCLVTVVVVSLTPLVYIGAMETWTVLLDWRANRPYRRPKL
jgi:hypothetical protein